MKDEEESAPNPEFESTEALAARTATNIHYWIRLRSEGSGPPYVKMGRLVRYRRIDTDAWLSARLRASTFDERPVAA